MCTDVQSNRKMLSLLLAHHGVSCDMTENGEKAVELIKQNPSTYDLVFMDYMMPVMVSVRSTFAVIGCFCCMSFYLVSFCNAIRVLCRREYKLHVSYGKPASKS